MANPIIHLKVGSRKPFAEESSVVDTAREAAGAVAEKRGNHRGGALFKVTSRMTVTPTDDNEAVELARIAIEPQGDERSAAGTGVGAVRRQSASAPGRMFADLSSADPKQIDALQKIGFWLQHK